MYKPHRKILAIMIIILAASASYSAPARPNMPPGVQSFAPTGTVPDNVSFRAVFRNPVVNKNQTGKIITPENNLFPIEINPPLQLEGRWQNERTFTAKLLAPLKSATTYTATIKENLRDRRGNAIGPGNFRFQTEGLSPTDIKASTGRDGNAYFTLSFNMRVDPARLRGFMKILNAQGREVAYNITGALPSRTIRVSVPIEKISSRQRFTVNIAAGLKSGEGDLGIEKDYSESVVLDPALIVQNLYAYEDTIRASFNFGVDPETVKSFITIEPPVNNAVFESEWSDESIIIRSEEFMPRNRYVITFRRGFPSKTGLVLKEDYKQAVILPDFDSEVKLPASGTYLTALDKSLIPIELLNVKRLQLDVWRMYENNIPYALLEELYEFPKDIAKRVYTREIALDLPLNERVRRSIPVSEITSGERGLFLITARDLDNEYWAESSQLLNLSNIGTTARLWDDSILIWANTLTTAQAIPDADVKIFSKAKQLLAQGKTNSGGIFYYELPDGKTWDIDNQPDLAIISRPVGEHTDLTYIQLDRNLLSREIFDTSGREWLRTGYDAIIFSPRDIYRTGETASFKAVVRNADLTTPEAFPVLFIVRDTLGRKVKQETLTLNAKGSAVTSINLPSNALTGSWTASLAIPGQEDKPITVYKFHVEDFAPPRIEVRLNSYRKFLVHNDTFTADIYARWLFGVDGAGLNYRTEWTAREGTFTPEQDRWRGFSFGDPSRKFTFKDGIITEDKLDNFGAAHANLTLDEDWQAPTIIDVTIRASVMEDGGRWVTGTITRPYYPAPYLLGIAALSDKMTVKNDLRFRVAAITPEEEPADPGELNAELYKVTWNYNMVEIDGRKRWQSSEELLKVTDKTLTLKNGIGEVSFRPEEYGTYLVRISDHDDNARAVYRFFADDPEYAGRGSSLIDRVEITLDKEFYRVGETAKIKVNAPFEGLLMMTVEGSKLLTRKIQTLKESEIVFEIPVTRDFMPNAWVTAWLIRPVQADDANAWAAHRAIGLARIKTDMSYYTLNVEINAPKKIEPATKFPVEVRISGRAPAINEKADVSIALVDDGVLGLTRYKTPDLLNHFWGLKKLNSQGFDIYDLLIPVENRTTQQLHPAGDEALGALAGDGNTQRFRILSLFEGQLAADEKGIIHAELDIPEFSGRGKLFVVAASGRSFGKAEQEVQIARDIVTETGLPRFSAPGDSFVIPTVVFNTSNSNKDVTITFIPEGMTLSESYASLRISAGSNATFNTQAKILEGDKAILRIVTSWKEDDADKQFTQEIELPVRSAWPVITLGGSGIFENGNTKLDIPIGNFRGDISGTLTLADTPAVNLTQAIDFLKNYPYSCLEQTISEAWPFLILPDALEEIDSLIANDGSVKFRTDSAIARIQSMQLYDGSFTMWPGGNATYNWGSVYAANFLLNARNAGINFPDEMLSGVLNWIRQYLPSMPAYNSGDEELDDITTKAYAVYVLTLNGERPLGWIEYIRENQSNLRASGNIYLAGAQSLIDGNADALRTLTLGNNNNSGRTLESDARNTAILLSMWLDVEPQAPEVTELAARLITLGNNGEWYSTQDNSAAIIALSRYNIEAAGAKSDLTARVTTETSDRALLEYSHSKPASVRVRDLPAMSEILIEAQGNGQGYYSWNVTGNPREQPKPERRNVNIECLYFDEDGNVIDISQPLTHGKVIQAVLTVKPAITVNNLALSYLLPAGLEIENPRIDESTETSSGIVNDIRDDRLILFFDRVAGEVSYGFKMRAVTRGTFSVPQISAFGMYDASVRFTGQPQSELVIR